MTSHETREDTLSILSDPILNKKFLAQNLQPYNLLLLGRQAASNSEFNRDSRILTDDGGVRTGNKNPARCLVAHSFNPSTQRQKHTDLCEFEASLDYKEAPELYSKPVSKIERRMDRCN